MILLEVGNPSAAALDGALFFAAKLEAHGYTAIIDEAAFPEDAGRSQYFDAAPYLADLEVQEFDHVIVLGADDLAEATLLRLRKLAGERDVLVSATGSFKTSQDQVSAAARIAYAIGREAEIIDVGAIGIESIRAGVAPQVGSAPAQPDEPSAHTPPAVFLVMAADQFEDPLTLQLVGAMAQIREFSINVITSGSGKDMLREAGFVDVNAFGYSDLPPSALARLADIAVFLGEGIPGERMAQFAVEMVASSKVTIDATADAALLNAGVPSLQGPRAIGSIAAYLEQTVLPNLKPLGREAGQNDWITRRAFDRLAREIGLPPPQIVEPIRAEARTVFVPTNGVGLGHAKRSALIASEIGADCLFLASHSCIPLIQSHGLGARPLVGRSEVHEKEFAFDVVNYLRMRRQVQEGDTLVFDGGHVFDSIYRTILEKQLNAVWIRRGLWRAGQSRTANLEREKAFNRVIVPDEAFDEIRFGVSYGPKVRNVGPVVDIHKLSKAEVKATRDKLAKRFGMDFKHLVVSMLGSGNASDHTAQVQSVSNMLAQRPDCLHLVVVWPSARIPVGLCSQRNTFLVRTQKAGRLSQCADLTLSAAGYNSFHELLYNGAPTIFIPQLAPILDQQETRARAASERGLAETVLSQELLKLERELVAFLDNGKADDIRRALAGAQLPAPGNRAAADLIKERANNG